MYSQAGNKMLTYTTVKGGVLAVDHCPHASALSLFGVVIAEAAYLLCIDFTHNFCIYMYCSKYRILVVTSLW